MGNDHRGAGERGMKTDVKSIINSRFYRSLLEYLGAQNAITKKNSKVNKPQMRMLGKILGGTF